MGGFSRGSLWGSLWGSLAGDLCGDLCGADIPVRLGRDSEGRGTSIVSLFEVRAGGGGYCAVGD